jgi:hypothetical protein
VCEQLAWYDSFLLPQLLRRSDGHANLLLLGEPPVVRNHPQICTPTQLNPTANEHCESRYGELYAAGRGEWTMRAMDDVAQAFADAHPGVFFFRAFSLFCTDTTPDSTCGALVPGTPLVAYVDTEHIGRAGAVYIATFLCSAMHRWGLLG